MGASDLSASDTARGAAATANAVTGETFSDAALRDMQALLLFGLGRLPRSRHLVATFAEARLARRWIREVLPDVLDAGPTTGDGPATATQLAFTDAGLAALGLPERERLTFSRSFVEGMCTDHRSRILGDLGPDAPANWRWGGPGDEVHVLVAAFGTDEASLAAHTAALRLSMDHAGMTVCRDLETSVPDDRREHFGFVDGISQPVLRGAPPNRRADDERWSLLEPGEFVLGLPDATGQPSRSPAIGALGSYLVVRELQQDVAAFRRFAAHAGATVVDKMVGRDRDGAPLAKGAPAGPGNDFGYAEADPDGEGCPFGAHVRRANPRDGRRDSEIELTLRSTKRHRLLRRGRSYGPPLPAEAMDDDGIERGLLFACLNADLERQFEFVQHHWLNSPRFGAAGEVDPLVGAWTAGGPRSFSMPADPVRTRVGGLEQFVRVRGGAYFFLPSIPMLRTLANP